MHLRQPALSLAVVLLSLSPLVAWEEGDEAKCPASGVYLNQPFGFRVTIPEGLSGCPNSPTWATDHGVLIVLDLQAGATIECYGAFNAATYETPEEISDWGIKYLGENATSGSVRITERVRSTVSGLFAERTVVQFEQSESGIPMVRDAIEILSADRSFHGLPSHLYSIVLITTGERYLADRAVFDQVVSSWQYIPNDKGR